MPFSSIFFLSVNPSNRFCFLHTVPVTGSVRRAKVRSPEGTPFMEILPLPWNHSLQRSNATERSAFLFSVRNIPLSPANTVCGEESSVLVSLPARSSATKHDTHAPPPSRFLSAPFRYDTLHGKPHIAKKFYLRFRFPVLTFSGNEVH